MMEIIRVAIFGNYFQAGQDRAESDDRASLQGLLKSVLVMAVARIFTRVVVDTCAFLTYTSSKEERQAR
jgi:hypothetical protein